MKPFGDAAMFCATLMKRNNLMRGKTMKICETGRSMIEMLGVLAIIGVLSVGSLTGYTKMMNQYRIDKSLEYIGMIVSKLSAYGSNADSYEGLDNYTAYKLNAIPSDMLVSYNDSTKKAELTNPYGGSANIKSASLAKSESDKSDNQSFVVTLTGLTEEACIALGSSAWRNVRNSSFVGLGAGTKEEDIEKNLYLNCANKTDNQTYAVACGGQNGSLPMDIGTASVVCTCPSNNCVFVMKFY